MLVPSFAAIGLPWAGSVEDADALLLIQHNGHGPTRVRTWYPPFCVVADLVIAVPLLAGWV